LLIGAGGMGKTALAGKRLRGLKQQDYAVHALSLRPEHDWQNSVKKMASLLTLENKDKYQDDLAAATEKTWLGLGKPKIDENKRAASLLSLLLQQHQGKFALLIDNLESKQDPGGQHDISDAALKTWLNTALTLSNKGLKLIVTSRWALADWENQHCLPLGKPIYTDYVAFARQQQLPAVFMDNSARLHQAYVVLGGNFRALEFFAAAVGDMAAEEEQEFLQQLQQASAKSQTDMALDKVYRYRTKQEQQLLHRLQAYQQAVDMDGIRSLALPEIKQAEQKVQQLLAVSLLEQYQHPTTGTEYKLSPLLRDWLQQQGIPVPETDLRQKAALYLLEQWDKDLKTDWQHCLNTHQALHDSGLTTTAQRFVLDWIVGPLNNAGRYQELLSDWLPPLWEAEDKRTCAEALGQTGKQYHHLGDYDTALDTLKKSLLIQQEIGDKSGEGTTLNNISQIYDARGDYDTALDYLKKSLRIQQEIGDKSGEGTTLNNISQIFQARGDYDTALDTLKKSLLIRQEIGDKSGEGRTLNNMATTAHARGDYDTALDTLKKS
ncbi:tetratricopeptide repeat protein, partial [Candidatus Venteria ishoeyi]|uniref:tetratricopeptide repeat protein n=1 Tax=Candidatus Venteria ishoeyi TaxID=1899563 RepID=UPI000A731BFD